MVWVLLILLVNQFFVFKVAGVSLMTIFCILPKVMFSGRVMASVVSWRVLLTLEAVGFISWLLWRGFIVHRLTFMQFALYLLLQVVSVLIYIIDENYFVYVSEDVD